MLHGGIGSGSRVGAVGADNPYADIFSNILTDSRNMISLLSPQTGINPLTGRPYTTVAPGINPATGQPYGINPATGQPYPVASSSIFGSMDSTTMLAIGAVGIGVLFFMMKR